MIDLLSEWKAGESPSRSMRDIVNAAARRCAGGDFSEDRAKIRGTTCSKYPCLH